MNDSAISSVSYTIEQIPEGFAKVTNGTKKIYIAKTELTYTEWYEIYLWAVSNGYVFQNLGREGNSGTDGATPTANSKQPVTCVSWRDAVVWCNAASEKAGLTPVYEYDGSVLREAENYLSFGTNTENTSNERNGKAENSTVKADANGYRLPTISEWESAAKSGSNYKYSGSDDIDSVAWYSVNSEEKTHDVGMKPANGYGLHDMSGNVWEWCQNSWMSDPSYLYYIGGGWDSGDFNCVISSNSSRATEGPYVKRHDRGFRVVRNAN